MTVAAGLGGGESGGNGLRVPHLPDEHDVGVLAHGCSHGHHVVLGVHADLPLVHRGHPVAVEDLDGILERQDVNGPSGVDAVDDGAERGSLPRAGRTGHQDQPSWGIGHRLDHPWEAQLLEGGTADPHPPQHQADRAALAEHVHPQPPQAGQGVSEVGFVLLFQLLPAMSGHDRMGHHFGVLRCERPALEAP